MRNRCILHVGGGARKKNRVYTARGMASKGDGNGVYCEEDGEHRRRNGFILRGGWGAQEKERVYTARGMGSTEGMGVYCEGDGKHRCLV